MFNGQTLPSWPIFNKKYKKLESDLVREGYTSINNINILTQRESAKIHTSQHCQNENYAWDTQAEKSSVSHNIATMSMQNEQSV